MAATRIADRALGAKDALALGIAAAALLALLNLAAAGAGAAPLGWGQQGAPAAKAKAIDAYGKLPLAFVPNQGQTDARVRFSAHAGGASFWFTPAEAAISLVKEKRGVNLRLRFLGANPAAAVEGTNAAPGRVNYLLGDDPAKWHTNVRTYGEVVYRNLWPGIDLAFRGEEGTLKYEFRLAPGARASDIRLAYRGAGGLALDKAGNLLIRTPLGPIADSRPFTYQVIGGRRIAVESRYTVAGSSYGLALGAYDRGRPLVIDPGLLYSTYLGGSGPDEGKGIAVDAGGNAYVTGLTSSANFPTTLGAFDTGSNGSQDAFVTKLNAAGSAPVYSTYVGGSGNDRGQGIAVDASGNAHITGVTGSANFPTTPGASDTSFNGVDDAFVTKLNAAGSAPVYSTYLGGAAVDDGFGIAIDAAGNAYAAGVTFSADFPATLGAFDTSFNGNQDAFVAKLDAAGSAIYSTYLGGSGGERGLAIAVDGGGSAYVTGSNAGASFPTTPGAFDTSFNGIEDVFVTRMNGAGSALVYSTYLGGSATDRGQGIAVDGSGNAYVTGLTTSAGFPTTVGALDGSFSGDDAFVTKLNTAGSALAYSTYLGGGGIESGSGIAVDSLGNAHVTGHVEGPFPTTVGAFDTSYNNGDGFVTKLNAAGSRLLYSTYLGGNLGDWGFGIAVDGGGKAYVTGLTQSADFPTTLGAFDRSFNFTADVFVTKLDLNAPPTAAGDGYAVNEDTTLGVAAPGVLANDGDTDGDTLSAVLVTGPANGALALNADGSFSYTPNANFNGSDSFTYAANDGTLASQPATVTISVVPVNDAPVAADDAYSVNEDETLIVVATGVLADDSDVDGDTLSAVLVNGPTNGSLALNADGSFSYTPSANFNGADSFGYRANDGGADSAQATVAITVNPVNDAPMASADGPYLGIIGSPVTFDGSASSDVEASALTYTWSFGDGSTLVTDSPNPTHTYAAAGIYTVTLVVSDGSADSAPTTTTGTIGDPIGSDRGDVDAFLSYAAPTERSVQLAAGTTSFNVTIIYGATINAGTLEVELNGSPFAGFSPAPGTSQTVTVPLSPGRNVLAISIDGALANGRTATDRDRLTFIVG